ncbi:hypothetical protein RJ641_001037 [Dillenia turbinata]|uniref:Uncharacterized protein n=1 Tax=Dillenia turbinata TaxID=194707 RepID=A0AAN8ZMX4_9MAGN
MGAMIMMIGVVFPVGYMMFRNKSVPSSSSYSKQTICLTQPSTASSKPQRDWPPLTESARERNEMTLDRDGNLDLCPITKLRTNFLFPNFYKLSFKKFLIRRNNEQETLLKADKWKD